MTRVPKYVLKFLSQVWRRKNNMYCTIKQTSDTFHSGNLILFQNLWKAKVPLEMKKNVCHPHYLCWPQKENNLLFLSYPKRRGTDLGYSDCGTKDHNFHRWSFLLKNFKNQGKGFAYIQMIPWRERSGSSFSLDPSPLYHLLSTHL